jgi:hypothetical protein
MLRMLQHPNPQARWLAHVSAGQRELLPYQPQCCPARCVGHLLSLRCSPLNLMFLVSRTRNTNRTSENLCQELQLRLGECLQSKSYFSFPRCQFCEASALHCSTVKTPIRPIEGRVHIRVRTSNTRCTLSDLLLVYGFDRFTGRMCS